jgi:mannose-6-phosphate isomerase-like protein (cupin superfamily)
VQVPHGAGGARLEHTHFGPLQRLLVDRHTVGPQRQTLASDPHDDQLVPIGPVVHNPNDDGARRHLTWRRSDAEVALAHPNDRGRVGPSSAATPRDQEQRRRAGPEGQESPPSDRQENHAAFIGEPCQNLSYRIENPCSKQLFRSYKPHLETDQEDFLVLAGEALAIVEGEERELHQWDFLHCPPGTNYVIVAAREWPCVVLAVGARDRSRGPDWGAYTVEESALRHGAGVESETTAPDEAYARFPGGELTGYRAGWLPD